MSFHSNGNLQCKGMYKNDEKNGEFINYWENGNLSSKGSFINGLAEAEWFWYRQDGALGYIETWKNNKKVGCKGECD